MAKRRKKVTVAGIRVTQREEELIEQFGNDSRGYNIECRFCGWLSVEHDEEEQQRWKESDKKQHEPGSDQCKKGFRTTLQNCANNIGYVPANIREWERSEKEFLEEEGAFKHC